MVAGRRVFCLACDCEVFAVFFIVYNIYVRLDIFSFIIQKVPT